MKKTLILAAAAIILAASCTKSEVTYGDETAIKLAPVTQMNTKTVYGPYESVSYNTLEKFNVFAQHSTADPQTAWDAISDGTGNTYLSDVAFKAYDSIVWGGDATEYYWPRTGSLFFAGYSPSEFEQAGSPQTRTCHFTEDTGSTITINGFKQGAYKYTNGEGALPDAYKMVDLMYFDVTASSTSANSTQGLTSNNAYAVKFNHSLSWLTFRFLCDNNNINDIYTVTKVVLHQVNKVGTLTTGTNPAWSGLGTAEDIVLFDKTTDTFTTGDNVMTYADNHAFVINDVLVIPQEIPTSSTLTVYFDQKANSSSTYEIPQSVTLTLTGGNGTDDTQDGEWVMNKHYTYNITFTANEILLEPSVANWDEITVTPGTTI